MTFDPAQAAREVWKELEYEGPSPPEWIIALAERAYAAGRSEGTCRSDDKCQCQCYAAGVAAERARCSRLIAEEGCCCDANEIPEPMHISSCPAGLAYRILREPDAR